MEAINHEFLVRRVYNCSRHGVKGADADIYRRMDMSQKHLNDHYWGKSKEQKEYDFYNAFFQVKNYVINALSNKSPSERVGK